MIFINVDGCGNLSFLYGGQPERRANGENVSLYYDSPYSIDYEKFVATEHRVATHAFAFPTSTNGLKDIAKHLGFRWRHDDVNPLDAIAWSLRAQKDPETWREELEAVVDNNEDDSMATKFIKDWLASRAVETGKAS